LKLQQEHGVSVEDNSNLNLRTSMRNRMSKSYIDELRGPNKMMDINNNENETRSSQDTNHVVQPKASSLSLPQIKFQNKLKFLTSQSALSLGKHNNSTIITKSSLMGSNTDEQLTTQKTVFINNNQLTVPSVGDYCLRISNTPSMCEEQQETEFNDSRLSDALGYLRMYQNQNRVQINSLEFNDREDLQVK
jgi:hypothetical protein